MTSEWDCVVVGGGAAGLSAGLVLGRARRRTLLLDVGGQSNRVAEGIGGLLGNDRRPPAEFYAAGRQELAVYGDVELRDAEAVRGERLPDGFALELGDGTEIDTRTVILATGMEYRYPDLPGARERWGRSVFHCPFCHGWEVRGQDLAVLGSDEMAVHRALLLRSWSDSVTLLSDAGELPADAAERLAGAGVEVDDRMVASVEGSGSSLTAVVFEDGSERALGGLLVGVTLHRRSDLPDQLGAARTRLAAHRGGGRGRRNRKRRRFRPLRRRRPPRPRPLGGERDRHGPSRRRPGRPRPHDLTNPSRRIDDRLRRFRPAAEDRTAAAGRSRRPDPRKRIAGPISGRRELAGIR